jgi:hypothetical protein
MLMSIVKTMGVSLLVLSSACVNQTPSDRTLALNYTTHAAKADRWLLNLIRTQPTTTYLLDPETNVTAGQSNIFGTLIVAHRLATLANLRPKLIPLYQTHLSSLGINWSREIRGARLTAFERDRSIGGQALILRLLVANPLPDDLEKLTERLAHRLAEIFENSTEIPEFFDDSTTRNPFLSRFYGSQAALALLEHYSATGELRSLAAARSALRLLEIKYPTTETKNFHPSQAPWLAEALILLNEIEPSRANETRVFLLADQLLRLQDVTNFPGRFWLAKGNDYGRPNSVRDAQSTRVLLMGLELATSVGDHRRIKTYRAGIRRALENLRAHQFDVGSVEAFPEGSKFIGAVRFRYNSALIRTDSVVFSAMAFDHASSFFWRGGL